MKSLILFLFFSVISFAQLQSGNRYPNGTIRWSVTSAPAVSTVASASKAAGAAGVKHVAECISYSVGATTAPALTKLQVNLRDGAAGAGTIVLQKIVVIPAATGQSSATHSVCGLNIVGTAATAMTLEFSALLTNLFEEVTLIGYDTVN